MVMTRHVYLYFSLSFSTGNNLLGAQITDSVVRGSCDVDDPWFCLELE